MTNDLILIVGMLLVETNQVKSIHPSGEQMTVVETVTAKTITPIAFDGKTSLLTNVVVLRTNSVELVQKEVNVPYPPGFAGSPKPLKIWRTKPKPTMRPPRDPLGIRQ